MSTEYNAAISVSQYKSSRKLSPQELYYKVVAFLNSNSKGDLYFVLKAITWYHFKLGYNKIYRDLLARFAECHKDTVSSINLRLAESGLIHIERRQHEINGYSSDIWDILAAIFGYLPNFRLSSTSLITSKLYNNHNIVSKCPKKSEFGLMPIAEKNQEVGKVCFSPKTGIYVPLELRPLNNTIEISRADQGSFNVSRLFYIDERRRYHEEERKARYLRHKEEMRIEALRPLTPSKLGWWDFETQTLRKK